MGTSTLVVGTDGLGGYLTRPEFIDSVDSLVRARSSFLSLVRTGSFKSRTVRLPKLMVGPGYEWISEAEQKPKTDVAIDQDECVIRELAAIIVLSERLLTESYSSPSIEQVLRAELAASAASTIDSSMWNGAGPSTANPNTPLGLLQTGESVHEVDGSDFDDGGLAILSGIQEVELANYRPTAIAIHPWALRALAALRGETSDTPLYPSLSGASPNLFGIPVTAAPGIAISAADTNGLRTTKVVVADFGTVFVGTMPSSFKNSDVATVDGVSMFETDSVAIRAVHNVSSPLLRRPEAISIITVTV